MRALIDTNVVLDYLLGRTPWDRDATAIFLANTSKKFDGYIAATTITNIFYIAVKQGQFTRPQTLTLINQLLTQLKVRPVNRAVLRTALKLPFNDYEDAVQHACATHSKLDAIVTRDLKDFQNSRLHVYNPVDFITKLPV